MWLDLFLIYHQINVLHQYVTNIFLYMKIFEYFDAEYALNVGYDAKIHFFQKHQSKIIKNSSHSYLLHICQKREKSLIFCLALLSNFYVTIIVRKRIIYMALMHLHKLKINR